MELEIFAHSPSLFIGLIGWAATNVIIWGSDRTDSLQKRALLVLSWGGWMFPAFNALSHQGIIDAATAVYTCGVLTIGILTLTALTTIKRRTRS